MTRRWLADRWSRPGDEPRSGLWLWLLLATMAGAGLVALAAVLAGAGLGVRP